VREHLRAGFVDRQQNVHPAPHKLLAMSGRAIGGRYELEQPLGSGAMSAVWLARDKELGRRVAVKLLARDADRARFEREAQAVAALSHPNICQLYDYGESEEGPYMVLEYLAGGTLEDRLDGAALPDEQTTRVAHELAAGLAHAHERGLVHRDLKPANVLFDTEGRAKIADFGIARIEGGHTLTEAGTVLGTAAYLSPEQAAGEQATPASDVYSFGVILFRMLTGRAPFVADNALELVRMHREQPPPRVEEIRPDAPALLAALAYDAMAKDPAQRPADGAAVAARLPEAISATMLLAPGAASLSAEASPLAEGHATQVIPRRPPKRRPALLPIVLAGALLLAIVGAAAAYLVTGSDDSPAATAPSLDLPTVGREQTSSSSTVATTAAETTTAPPTTAASTTTTEQSTTRETSTTQTTTTASTPQTTTAPATTPLPPTTTEPSVTTAPLPATTTAPPATTVAPTVTTAAAATTTTTATGP
jgi:serine/threonine-protein kinase